MTALDGGILLLFGLLAAGGYRQGLLRGLLRLATLMAIAAAAALLSLGLAPGESVDGLLLRAGFLFGGVVVISATAAWLLERLIPPPLHRSALNTWLGVVPALIVGLFVVGLAIGIAHRIAFGDELQRYLADGVITGPLTQPLRWLERAVVTTPS